MLDLLRRVRTLGLFCGCLNLVFGSQNGTLHYFVLAPELGLTLWSFRALLVLGFFVLLVLVLFVEFEDREHVLQLLLHLELVLHFLLLFLSERALAHLLLLLLRDLVNLLGLVPHLLIQLLCKGVGVKVFLEHFLNLLLHICCLSFLGK